MSSNLFYTFYDSFFHAKDYSQETNLIFELSDKYGIKDTQKILEVGFGSGNHTAYLADRVKEVVGVDIDREMVKLASDKLAKNTNVKLHFGTVETLKESGFDLALAMFNVVTYIDSFDGLISFAKSIAKRLNSGGLLVFDCWNGVAAIKDPPSLKKNSVEVAGQTVSWVLKPEIWLMDQKVTLTYLIEVVSKSGQIQKDNFSFVQTLWTPKEINWVLKQAGFEIIFCSPIDRPKVVASEKDWKILFCVRKLK